MTLVRLISYCGYTVIKVLETRQVTLLFGLYMERMIKLKQDGQTYARLTSYRGCYVEKTTAGFGLAGLLTLSKV